MKITHILGSLNRGGTETFVLDLLKNSDKAPFDMICLYRKEGNLIDEYLQINSLVHKVDNEKWNEFFRFLKCIREILIYESTDIIHTHQRIDTAYVWLASIGLPVKIIQTVHEFDYKISLKDRLLISLSFKMADGNIFVSEYLRKYYNKEYKIKKSSINTTLYNGIDFKKFNFTKGSSLRTELKISNRHIVMGMVGNFVEGHDQITVCHFLYLLRKEGIEFRFLFVGAKDNRNPHLYDECVKYCDSKKIKENVIFMGSRADVPSILLQLDVFIYSSDHDTFGIAVIEAIGSGIPVFVNNWDVMNEITDGGKRAYLYKSKDEYDLFNKFMEYYCSPNKFKEEAINNMKWVREKYDLEHHVLQLNNIYSKLLNL